MLREADIIKDFLGQAFLYAVCLHNRAVILVLESETPQWVFPEKAPNHSRIRIFECAAYVYEQATQRTYKLYDRAILGVYISSRHEMYQIYIWHSRNILTTKYTLLDEMVFPSAKTIQAEYVPIEEELKPDKGFST